MKLSRDQLIKALNLHCRNIKGLCGDCPLRNEAYCDDVLCEDALDLIQKLTEKNKRLKAEVSVKRKLLTRCSNLVDSIKADTVQNMQTRFALHFGTYTDRDTVMVRDLFWLLNKFAEEEMEEG